MEMINFRSLASHGLLFCSFLLSCFTSTIASPITYQLVDLGLLCFEKSEASSINNKGQICGTLNDGRNNNIFICDPRGKFNYTSLSFSTLPIINSNGDVFGSYLTHAGYNVFQSPQETVFVWNKPFDYFTSFHIKNLAFPAPLLKDRAVVLDVNDSGQILVMNDSSFEEYDGMNFDYQVWIYVNGIYSKIEHPKLSIGYKLNNQSQVLGSFFERTADTCKVIPSIYDVMTKKVCVLDFPGNAYGMDINDKGQVVGIFKDSNKNVYQGFFRDYSASDFITIENFHPIAVNNTGIIVGKYIDGGRKNRPAIWINGTLFDLYEVVSGLMDDKGHIWQSLDRLININDEGYIIGRGKYNGKKHGFLLVPISKQQRIEVKQEKPTQVM
jgi:hypothetical protein